MACLLLLLLVKAQTEYLVTVNSNNSAVQKINSIPGVRYLQSSSTYNQTTKEYTVIDTWQPGQAPGYLHKRRTSIVLMTIFCRFIRRLYIHATILKPFIRLQ